jgi:hypothetical protein
MAEITHEQLWQVMPEEARRLWALRGAILPAYSDPNSIRTDHGLSTIEQSAVPSSSTITFELVSDQLSYFGRRLQRL